MATYTYTGRLTDFGEAPFPAAQPKLWVEPCEPAFGPSGPLAMRRIEVPVSPNGLFTVNLLPSVETSPPAKYRLTVEWLDATGVLAGWTEWDFLAQHGGGQIAPGDVPLSVWWVGPPWPAALPTGFYLDRFTNDVGRKI